MTLHKKKIFFLETNKAYILSDLELFLKIRKQSPLL